MRKSEIAMNYWTGMTLLALVAVLTGIGHICFKKVALRNLPLKQKLFAAPFLVGMTCFLMGPVLAILAAKAVPFSLLYAMTSLNFVFILIFSKWILNEPIDARKIVGVATIIVGLATIAA